MKATETQTMNTKTFRTVLVVTMAAMVGSLVVTSFAQNPTDTGTLDKAAEREVHHS